MGALDGLKVADFSWVGAGPRATKDLADNGADVVKIESRKRLDLGRMSPPFARGESKNPDASAFFAQTNTSKKSVTIDLSNPEGIEVARALINWSDVVVENFGPGFMDRIGLGYDQLRAIKPDIILASVSVAGRTGPMAGFRGYGNSAAAHSGHAAMTGWPGSEPHLPPFAYGDVVAPMFLSVGILAALEYRATTGQGQHIDVSQIEPMVHVIADLFADPDLAEKPGNAHCSMAPHGVFPCKGNENWLALCVETDQQWRSFCQAVGRSEWVEDARFATSRDRLHRTSDLEAEISRLTMDRDKFDLARELAEAGIPAAPVLNGKEVFENEELRAAGHFNQLDHPVLGPCMMPAPPMRFHETPATMSRAPLIGEHTRQILLEAIGMDVRTFEDLFSRGVLA